MGMQTFHLCSWSSLILFPFLLCLIEHVQISNAYAYCQYYKPDDLWPYIKQCEYTCCPLNKNTRANTTCCNPVLTYATMTTTYTIFGYPWWTVLLCSICILSALYILLQYYKRIHILKHKKHFNSVVDPTAAFTISKNDSNASPTGCYTVGNDTIVLEQNPPSYTSTTSPLPPPYVSVDLAGKKTLE